MMDTLIEVVFYGPNGPKAADELEARLQLWEQNTSMYQPSGDIGRLNSKAGDGEAVFISEDVLGLLAKAKEWSLQSEGSFDLTIAPLALLWNVRGESPQVPSTQAVAKARALVDAGDLWLDMDHFQAKLMRPGQAVDLGAIAKGAASAIAFETMDKWNIRSGYVSFGGNLAVRGRHPNGRDFVFGVRDPWGTNSAFFATVSISGQTMATTGDYIRYFEEDGVRYSHILDPRTGYPVQNDLRSVSIIASDGALADFLSTALFVAGKDKALSLLEKAEFQGIVVDREKNVYASAGLEGNLLPNPACTEFHFQFL